MKVKKLEPSLICSIIPKNKVSWENKVFITFDTDWVDEDILDDTISLCASYNIPITIFATNKSDVLKNIINDKKHFEIGIHPNYNKLLLSQEPSENTYETICGSLMDLFPNSKSVRSHSLCFGSLIQTVYKKFNLTHDSSLQIPYQYNKFSLFPWEMWDGLFRVPYFYCDYITASTTKNLDMFQVLKRRGLKIFGLHPIHVYLNIEKLDRYQNTRSIHKNPKELIKYRYNGFGARNRLIELLSFLERQ